MGQRLAPPALRLAVCAVYLLVANAASAQEPSIAGCMIRTLDGSDLDIQVLPGGERLFARAHDLFVLRVEAGTLAVERIHVPTGDGDIGRVLTYDVPGVGALVRTSEDLFLAHMAKGALVLDPVTKATLFSEAHKLPGGELLVLGDSGSYLVRPSNGTVTVDRIDQSAFGHIVGTYDFPGGRVLVQAKNGLFLVQPANDRVVVTAAGHTDVKPGFAVGNFQGIGELIVPVSMTGEPSLILAHLVNDGVAFDPITNIDTGPLLQQKPLLDLPGIGMFVATKRGWFLARVTNGALTVTRAGNADTGPVLEAIDFPGVGILMRAEAGWFLAHAASGALAIDRVSNVETGRVYGTAAFPGALYVHAEKTTVLAHMRGGAVRMDPYNPPGNGSQVNFPDAVFVATQLGGSVLVRTVNGAVTVDQVGGIGYAFALRDFAGGGMLIASERGLLHAHVVGGMLVVEPVGKNYLGTLVGIVALSDGEALLGSRAGLFRVRATQTGIAIASVDGIDVGAILAMHAFPNGTALLMASKGWFLARLANDRIVVDPIAPSTGFTGDWHDVPGGGVLVRTFDGMLIAAPSLQTHADCVMP